MNESLNRKIGASLNLANMFISVAIGLVYIPFVLRFLGQGEYGVFTLANSIISYITILDLGFGNALVRYSARAKAENSDEKDIYGMFLVFYLIVSAVALVAGIVIYKQIGSFFSTSFTVGEIEILKKVYIILLANTIIAFPSSVFSSIIRTHERFVFANGITLISNFLRHISSLVVLYLGFHSVSLAVTSLVFTIIVAVINIIFCFKKLQIKIGFKKFSKAFYKEVFLYSFFILINIIVDQLYASTDNIILGKFCGSAVVAVYGIGIVFQTYFMQFSTAIAGVFLPHISKLSVKEDGNEEISNIFVKVGRVQFLVLSFILIGYVVLGKNFIQLWTGEGYDDAYFIALIIMIPDVIHLSQNVGISVLQARNKHAVRSVMIFIVAVLNVIISIPLAIKYGGIGAAIGTGLGSLLGQGMFMNWYYYKKMGLNIPLFWKEIGGILLKSIPVVVMFKVISMIVNSYSWSGFVIKGLVSVTIAVPYYILFVLNDDEKRLLRISTGKKK